MTDDPTRPDRTRAKSSTSLMLFSVLFENAVESASAEVIVAGIRAAL